MYPASLYLLRLLQVELGAAASISLLPLLLLQEEQSVDLVGDRVLRADGVGDLLTADQAGHDAGSDNKGQDEAVHAVPVGSTAAGSSAGVIVVQEGEGEELADQCIFDGEQQGGPGNGRGDDTGSVAPVTVLATVSGPFETPVDSSKEREDLEDRFASDRKLAQPDRFKLTTAP